MQHVEIRCTFQTLIPNPQSIPHTNSPFSPRKQSPRAALEVVAAAPASTPVPPSPARVQEVEAEAEEGEGDWGIEWTAEETAPAPAPAASAVSSPGTQTQATTAGAAAVASPIVAKAATPPPEGVCLARVSSRSIFVRGKCWVLCTE